jgi:hypothetical protein
MISIFTEKETELLLELLDAHIDNSRDNDTDDYNEQVKLVNSICKKLTGDEDTYEIENNDDDDDDDDDDDGD